MRWPWVYENNDNNGSKQNTYCYCETVCQVTGVTHDGGVGVGGDIMEKNHIHVTVG